MASLDQARMFARFAWGLPRFLGSPLTLADSRRIAAGTLRGRDAQFLRLARRGIYGYERSPYRALLLWADVEYGDLETLVRSEGIEGALGALFDAGIRIGLDEFKGKRPIERSGLRLETAAEDFDNPLLSRDFEVATGGSTGPRRRLAIDFDLLVFDAAFQHIYYDANGMTGRPGAVWRPIPPGSSGIKNALLAAKTGRPLVRWFSPQPLSITPALLPPAVFTAYAAACGMALGGRLPRPRFTPLDRGVEVARWAAKQTAAGRPAWLSMPAGNAVRTAQAALDAALDIAGTTFRVGGEPLTPAKYAAIRKAGADTVSGWALSEAGPLGGGCANREQTDEVHINSGKIAVIQRDVSSPGGAETFAALHLTTLLPQTPKIMLNVDSGDYGVLSQRRCGCPLDELGYDWHLHTIRNYEKITVNGMHFVGAQLASIVEETLPRAFGGAPTDYQFVEEEAGAVSRVTIVMSPRLGPVDESRVIDAVLGALGGGSRGDEMMAANWRHSGVLRVERREPYSTPAAKTPAICNLQR